MMCRWTVHQLRSCGGSSGNRGQHSRLCSTVFRVGFWHLVQAWALILLASESRQEMPFVDVPVMRIL
ncbi:hypothetical protein ADK58_28135 [Streptomyces sp. XY152]|nr:hypothetical protein ADK58_28135 [Streptomyces sp. XY152]